jgi:hypothetical protein
VGGPAVTTPVLIKTLEVKGSRSMNPVVVGYPGDVDVSVAVEASPQDWLRGWRYIQCARHWYL